MSRYWNVSLEERVSPSNNQVLATFNKEVAKGVSQDVIQSLFGKPNTDISNGIFNASRYHKEMHLYVH